MQTSSQLTNAIPFSEYQFSLPELALHFDTVIAAPDTSLDLHTDSGSGQAETTIVASSQDKYFDDFVEDLNDPECVQRIYDFSLSQVRGMVDYNDEDDVVQEVFYRLTKWPIGKKYNSARHYFSLLKITIRQAIAAYWKRRHSQRNDVRKRVFISQLNQDSGKTYEFADDSEHVLSRLQIKELARQLIGKAQELPGDQRVMFEMRFLYEKSHEEIAAVLKISIRTSYRLETKVREILRSHFADQEDC